MNARHLGLFGLAALGLALTAPVQADPEFMESAFIVAQRDRGERGNRGNRGERTEVRRQDDRRDDRHDVEHEESQGYGYGYERRQQHRFEDDDRQRGRR